MEKLHYKVYREILEYCVSKDKYCIVKVKHNLSLPEKCIKATYSNSSDEIRIAGKHIDDDTMQVTLLYTGKESSYCFEIDIKIEALVPVFSEGVYEHPMNEDITVKKIYGDRISVTPMYEGSKTPAQTWRVRWLFEDGYKFRDDN